MTHLLIVNEWEAFEESMCSFLHLITTNYTIYAVESLTSCTTGIKITSI